MTAQKLKNSILQMAVSGKLVPQDPNDEPASVLLERIKAEKEELIKSGKIKKDKKSSEIFRGASRNIPYTFCEQVGKDIRDISEEIPFEIPESWEWVRFSNLSDFSLGKTPSRKEAEYWTNTIYPWVSIADMVSEGNVLSTKEKINNYAADNIFKNRISPVGTLLMSFKLTVGKVSILGIDAYHNEAIISIYPFVDDNKIMTSYLFKIMPLITQNGDTKAAIKGDTLNKDSLGNLLIPLPPLNEQERIVDKLDQIYPILENYKQAEAQLTELNSNFPELLKKSILQEAVQGKLVPQDPNDEPASVLLERIRAEKQALIKAGKIKKDKHESVIVTRDKIPYTLPDNWVWCRLADLGEIVGGGTPKTNETDFWNNGTIPWLTPADMKFVKGKYVSQGERFITQNGLSNSSAQLMPKGAILYSSRAPIGYIAIAQNDICTNQGFKSLVPINIELNQYLYYCLIERTSEIQSRASGTTFKEISGTEFGNTLIPLPPLFEQHRIVEKIEELMPIINTLSK